MFRILLNLFSRYAHPFEKKADKFFRRIKASSSRSKTHKKLEKLMQENLIVLNLWMEKKYKNYVYLKKRVRRQMYSDVELMVEDFLEYAEKQTARRSVIEKKLEAKNFLFSRYDEEKILYLGTIMQYLRPGDRYTYQAGANFGKLLKNPKKEKLVGDCNQIVTLYTYLYSLRFPISDLKIKILPKHVCLHFDGIDIEATNGTFQRYIDFEEILPITELLSTNILDVVDVEARTAAIHPRTIVKRAQLAKHISSMHTLVQRNLEISYRNLGITLLNESDYKGALFFFEKLGDLDLLQRTYHNAAVYYLKKKKFKEALYYAKHSRNEELRRSVIYQHGFYYYKQKSYNTALKYFKQIGDDRMIKACYQSLYNQLSLKVKNVKTIKQAKQYRSDYQKMLKFAKLADNQKSVDWVKGVLKDMLF